MPVDHFAFAESRVFRLRYLYNDTYFKAGGPIFFYCGNEGDIELFTVNTGIMWDWAPRYGALLVFAEHRFYGKTMPFGNDSYTSAASIGYLSSEQALADFAVLLTHLKKETNGAERSPVIAFGGSYGGMLAAWMRIKYPHIIDGALAASAPILQFTGLTPCWVYNAIVTRTFDHDGAIVGNKHCTDAMRKGWPALRRLAATDIGRPKLNTIFHLCPNSLIKKPTDANKLVDWLYGAFSELPMVDYPYQSSFLGTVPAWPVREACKHLKHAQNATDTMLALQMHDAVSVYLNYTGDKPCYDTSASSSPALGDKGWDMQACTEMVMPMCSNGTDMFEPYSWNVTTFANKCAKTWYDLPTRPYWAVTNYGGDRLSAASNIIFSNGDLDPWSGGGVRHPIPGAREVYIIRIKLGAHHYDLRANHVGDTDEIREVRAHESAIISKWIKQAQAHNL